ncbi:MAG: DMT family transporter [Bifidobacterium sp.]|uniref:DMT family transporter n=1 Tax=Bifidobacterium fermentum TaxID=3059035 RepID=A0AB39UAS1_9BIFI
MTYIKTNSNKSHVTGILPDVTLLMVAAIWGGSYLAAKDLSAASSPAAVMCARFVPAAVLLLIVQAYRRPPGLSKALRPGLMLGVLRSCTIALETVGVTMTSATNAGLIIGLSVLITPIMESLVAKRRLSAQLMGAVALAVLGISGLIGNTGLNAPNLGDLLMIGAAIIRAALGVAEARFTASGSTDVMMLTTIEITFGAVMFSVWGGIPLIEHMHAFSPTQWGEVLFLSMGCTVAAFLGQLWATKLTSASRAGMLLGSEPGWALLIGMALGGERIGTVGIIGAAILLGALIWGRCAERQWRTGTRV